MPTTKESGIDDKHIPIEECKEQLDDSSSEDLESINEEGRCHCFYSKYLDSCFIDFIQDFDLENIIESDYRPSPLKRPTSNKNLSKNITFVNATSAQIKTKTGKGKR